MESLRRKHGIGGRGEGQNDAAVVASGYQVKGLGKVRIDFLKGAKVPGIKLLQIPPHWKAAHVCCKPSFVSKLELTNCNLTKYSQKFC